MSNFDPHGLYRSDKSFTRKGQILQQKSIERPGIIKKREIPRSLQVLQTYGYLIYPPGYTPPIPPPSPEPEPDPHEYDISLLFPFILGENIEQSFNIFQYRISRVWNSVRNNFTPLLNIPLENITYSWVTFGVTSLTVFPQHSFSSPVQPTPTIRLYHNTQSVSYTLIEGEYFSDIDTNSLVSLLPFNGIDLSLHGRIISHDTPTFFYHSVQNNQLQLPLGTIAAVDGNNLWSQLYNNQIDNNMPLLSNSIFALGGYTINLSGYMYVTLRVRSE